MQTLSTRITGDKAQQIKDFCFTKNMSVSQFLESAIDAFLEGKIEIKKKAPRLMRERIPLCPECNFLLYYAVGKEEGPYLFCLYCGFWAKIGVPTDKWHEGNFEIGG